MSRNNLGGKEIPLTLYDGNSNTRYQRGKFLGKGGFARCYEILSSRGGAPYAGKIVPKTLLTKQNQKDKMSQEIALHRSINHENVVKFYSFFEDENFVYVVLELCKRRSLMELHKRRKAITEPETRYYMKQIVNGVQYLHKNKIIHRDLKLGNLFLTEEMQIRIGDLGLATKVDYIGERKKTLCGTPNYIAPEIIGKKGHSFEVDIWSLGCIMYTLLVGKPPFETSSLKETYNRIKKIEYRVPSFVSLSARNLIEKMLQGDPKSRPDIDSIQNDDFLVYGYLPPKLPTTCLTVAPRFSAELLQSAMRKPLQDINNRPGESNVAGKVEIDDEIENNESPDFHMDNLIKQVRSLNSQIRKQHLSDQELISRAIDCEDPAAHPVLWISKWVDYTDKYGLGYQLCDNSTGVLFNDCTRLLLYNNHSQVAYINKEMQETYHLLSSFPDVLSKKVTLLKYFRSYMSKNLLKAGADMAAKEGDQFSRLPFLRTWFRTRSAIILHLSNGALQINFFADHAKIILCPHMGAVTYIDPEKKFRTFRMTKLAEFGCIQSLAERLRFAETMLEKLILNRTSAMGTIKPSS